MQTITKIREKLEEIRNNDFEVKEYDELYRKSIYVNLLRKALICFNDIATNSLDKKISKEEAENLYNELEEIMKKKLKEINDNFSEETMNNMLATYKRGILMWPMDIFIIDDAVFSKEATLSEFGFIEKIRTFMFDRMRPYYNTSSQDFNYIDSLPEWINKVDYKSEDTMNISKFISDSINKIYKKEITKPIYYNDYFDGIISYGVNIYINMNFYDIVGKILTKEESDIKICIQDRNDIILYYVHQHFKDDKPIWDVVKTNNKIWKLSEEILKLKKEQSPNFQKKKIK